MQHPIPAGVGGCSCQHPVPPHTPCLPQAPCQTHLFPGSGGAPGDGPAAGGGGASLRQGEGLGAHLPPAPRSLHQEDAPRSAQHPRLLRAGEAAGRGWGRARGRANPEPPAPPASSDRPPRRLRLHRTALQPHRASLREVPAPAAPALDVRAAVHLFQVCPQALCPPCPSSRSATSSLLCLPAATTPRETPTQPGCWRRSWLSPASAQSA